MTVREKLFEYHINKTILVKQRPIQRIDSSCNLVVRDVGSATILRGLNRNYLDYEVVSVKNESDDIDVIVCKANPSQEHEVIAAMYSGRMWGKIWLSDEAYTFLNLFSAIRILYIVNGVIFLRVNKNGHWRWCVLH